VGTIIGQAAVSLAWMSIMLSLPLKKVTEPLPTPA